MAQPGSTALTHYPAGAAHQWRLDGGSPASRNGYQLTCLYFVGPTSPRDGGDGGDDSGGGEHGELQLEVARPPNDADNAGTALTPGNGDGGGDDSLAATSIAARPDRLVLWRSCTVRNALYCRAPDVRHTSGSSGRGASGRSGDGGVPAASHAAGGANELKTERSSRSGGLMTLNFWMHGSSSSGGLDRDAERH